MWLPLFKFLNMASNNKKLPTSGTEPLIGQITTVVLLQKKLHSEILNNFATCNIAFAEVQCT